MKNVSELKLPKLKWRVRSFKNMIFDPFKKKEKYIHKFAIWFLSNPYIYMIINVNLNIMSFLFLFNYILCVMNEEYTVVCLIIYVCVIPNSYYRPMSLILSNKWFIMNSKRSMCVRYTRHCVQSEKWYRKRERGNERGREEKRERAS